MPNSNEGLKRLFVTRPSDITREAHHQSRGAAVCRARLWPTSIRAIVAKARVNQAAINYHFDGKDGLYREVLRSAFAH